MNKNKRDRETDREEGICEKEGKAKRKRVSYIMKSSISTTSVFYSFITSTWERNDL
jgi:hypothetical protein